MNVIMEDTRNASKSGSSGKIPSASLSIRDLGMKLAKLEAPEAPADTPDTPDTPVQPDRRALVVDNDAFFVEFLTELLEEKGYTVIKAGDGQEGMDRLKQEKIDIMFVDMVMPKIDGWQLIQYTRKKYPGRWFPIVAVSGTIIEQLDKLESIGADYYIAKGPMEKMKVQFNEFMQRIEAQPYPIQEDGMVVYTEASKPKREAVELMEMVAFQKAVMEGLGLGLLVCDRQTRVIVANRLALTILDLDDVSVLNSRITSIFTRFETQKLVHAMNEILDQPERKRSQCLLTVNDGTVRFVVSLLFYKGVDAGWVLALEETETCQQPASKTN